MCILARTAPDGLLHSSQASVIKTKMARLLVCLQLTTWEPGPPPPMTSANTYMYKLHVHERFMFSKEPLRLQTTNSCPRLHTLDTVLQIDDPHAQSPTLPASPQRSPASRRSSASLDSAASDALSLSIGGAFTALTWRLQQTLSAGPGFMQSWHLDAPTYSMHLRARWKSKGWGFAIEEAVRTDEPHTTGRAYG